MKTKITLFLVYFTSLMFGQYSVEIIKEAKFRGAIRDYDRGINTIFMVGYEIDARSFFSKSTDGGSSWSKPNYTQFGRTDNLLSISFTTDNIGYLAGDNGIVYKTTNSGDVWKMVGDTAVYKGRINGMHFFTADSGIIMGSLSNGISLMRTVDGGNSWQPISHSNTGTLYDYESVNSNTWIISASSGKFLRSTNGGLTFTESVVSGPTSTLYDIEKINDSTFMMCGTSGRLYKSIDSAKSFTQIGSGVAVPIYTVTFISDQVGYYYGSNGIIFKTTNQGNSWVDLGILTTETLYTGFVVDSNTLLTGGFAGTLMRSSDGGDSWTHLEQSMRDNWGIYAQDKDRYLVVADRGEIATTDDAGKTWQRANFATGNLMYDGVRFGDTLYISGREGEFFASFNKGKTWRKTLIPGTNVRNYKLQFFGRDTAYMVNNQGRMLYTTNGGLTFNQIDSLPGIIYDIKMLTKTKGYAAGSNTGIFKTDDGINFSNEGLAVLPMQATALVMVDSLTGYVAGQRSTIFKTTDGFKTVELVADTTVLTAQLIHDFVVLDSKNIWALGENGMIMRLDEEGFFMPVTYDIGGYNLIAGSKLNDSTFIAAAEEGFVYRITDKSRNVLGTQEGATTPLSYELFQNYPNPFNPSTTISFSIADRNEVSLEIYSVVGELVKGISMGELAPGNHKFEFNANSLTSGVYFYRIIAGGFTQTKKMSLIK